MEKRQITVGDGLRQVLLGELLAIIALVASTVGRSIQIAPLTGLSALVGLVSTGMIIIGLAGVSAAHSSYRAALVFAVLELALSVATGLVPHFLRALLSVLTALAGVVTVWCVCSGTRDLLLEQEEEPTARWAGIVWKLYAVGSVLSGVVYAVFIYGPWLPAARLPVMIAAPLLQMAMLLVYLRFLDRSQHILRGK